MPIDVQVKESCYMATHTPKLSIPRPRAFVLDFDGTITTKDTIDTLAQFGISKQATRGLDLKGEWDEVVTKYGEDFSTHVENYRPVKEDRRTLKEEVNYCRSLKEIEKRSFGRITSSGIFKGIDAGEWHDFGVHSVENGLVKLRNGIGKFVSEVMANNGNMCGIVSVNFSRYFIRGVLAQVSSALDGINIIANAANAAGILEGFGVSDKSHPAQVIATSEDKLAALKDMLGFWRSNGHLAETNMDTVYIGDSGTDIECLMEDRIIGIVILEDGQSSLMETFKRVGVEVFHIRDFREKSEKSVYWARDFEEIAQSPLINPISR
ncbi:UPF0655 protein [Lachnellula suecica]|uniref:UPF0655 protein n=1 Tax=Lachnellula suecica TaxID=602035 RepID=A0A8T9CKF5_9HELO|nr:UPF0655 protein [Lachnellula suecica]